MTDRLKSERLPNLDDAQILARVTALVQLALLGDASLLQRVEPHLDAGEIPDITNETIRGVPAMVVSMAGIRIAEITLADLCPPLQN